ncbi:hypothetical protein IGI04_012872 [Brassica rapa subsp. trilocularis]|uniref:Anaphase-promoting complex subunit 4 WD40 domain-containing protein n=1 Tax=Brassica rapa subsp. trilocularis TaxID=1813537 RepID=A0ABQ7N7U5_BRACM|nr:hypothetical protein IGI04_012872 [Brassica rapa subsp. trilocularis]
MEVDEVSDGLTEFNMDNYDEEDDDIQLFSSGIWDLYYPSNELDPTRFLFKRLLGTIMLQKCFSVGHGKQPPHSGFKWSAMSDVESLAWNPHSEHSSVVSLEDGTMKGFDIRAAQSATGSMDKTIKLWGLTNNERLCIASHKPKVGAVFSISFSVDNPFLLTIGGSKREFHAWDTLIRR